MLTSNAMQYMPQNTNKQARPQSEQSSILLYALVFLLSMAASLCVVFALPHFGIAAKFGGTGHDGYLELARSLYNGEGYRFSADGAAAFHRPPLYSLLLTPLMGMSESVLKTGVVALNSLLLTIACVYTRRICALLSPQAIIGTIAMALLVCNPWVLRLVSSPLSAVMQMALYAALCFYFLQFCDKFRTFSELPTSHLINRFLQITLLTTAMCFAHGTSIYVCASIFAVAAITMLVNHQWKLLGLLIMTATLTLAALSPWAMRNAEVLDRVELSSSGAGFTYFLGNSYWGIDVGDYNAQQSSEMNALRMGGIANPNESMMEYWGVTDPVVDNQLREAMIKHANENPTEVLKKSMLNLADIFFPITHTAYCATGNFSIYCAESTSNYQIATRLARTVLMLVIVGLAFNYLLSNRIHKLALARIAMAGAVLHIVPYLPIATYAHHGIYSMGALPILCALAAASLYRSRIKQALNSSDNNSEETWYKASNQARGLQVEKKLQPALQNASQQRGVDIDLII